MRKKRMLMPVLLILLCLSFIVIAAISINFVKVPEESLPADLVEPEPEPEFPPELESEPIPETGDDQSDSVELLEEAEDEQGAEQEVPEVIKTAVIIEKWRPMQLVIPAIDLDYACVGEGDVLDLSYLQKGPAHFTMSDLPSTEKGNVAFAGRWQFFGSIISLEEGDEIFLDVDGYRFIYEVVWKEVVDKYDWEEGISTTEIPSITLQTSYPINSPDPDFRLNIRGVLREVVKAPASH